MANVSSSNGLEKRPKLRFPGFDEPWKETALSSVLTERNEYAEKDGTYEHATLSKEGIYGKTARYDRDFLVSTENKKYKVTHLGDLCYNPANLKFGVICLNTYGDAIFSPIYVTFEIDASSDPDFIGAYLTRWDFINRALKYQQGTVYERMAVSPEDFVSIKCCFPQKAEQTRLAEFITLLDNRIAAQGKYVESLKKYKRGLLSNLFSEKSTQGCTTKSYYFSEIAQRRSEKYDPSSGIEYPCVELENIEQETGKILATVPSTAQSSIKNIAMSGDTLFGKLRPYLRKYAFAKKTMACSSEIWALIPSDVVLPKFLFYLVQTEQFLRVANISSGTKMPRAEWSNIEKAEFFIPDFTVQRKVVSLLEGLDQKITFADSMLFCLNRLKSSLLQQLFI